MECGPFGLLSRSRLACGSTGGAPSLPLTRTNSTLFGTSEPLEEKQPQGAALHITHETFFGQSWERRAQARRFEELTSK
jgi:hypothetical protein